ncbi:hypothetical protein HKD37_08G022011 [Glycine soja]
MASAPSNSVSQSFPNSIAKKLDGSNHLHWRQHDEPSILMKNRLRNTCTKSKASYVDELAGVDVPVHREEYIDALLEGLPSDYALVISIFEIPFTTLVILCDNQSIVSIVHNPVFHSRTKHMKIDVFFVREKILAK